MFADIVLARVVGSTAVVRENQMDPLLVKIGAVLLTLKPPIGTPSRGKRLEVQLGFEVRSRWEVVPSVDVNSQLYSRMLEARNLDD